MQTSAGKVLASVFWDVQGILFIDFLEKRRTVNSEYYRALLVRLKEEIAPKWPHMKKKKSVLSPRQCIVWQVDCNDGKTTWIVLWIASAPILFSRSAPSDYWLFVDLKRMLQGKRPGFNDEVIPETGIFWGQRQIYKKGIELLEKRWNQYHDYVDE